MHNLSTFTDSDGQERRGLYSLRENPWHKLGTVVEVPVADPRVLELAGLAWEVQTQGMYRADMEAIQGFKATIRSDDRRLLGIVGENYQTLQNEAMLAFFRQVAGTSEMVVETAGSLGQGETVWILARIPGLVLEKGDDLSHGYMLIRNSHDGSSSVGITPTMVRVVCQNTLRMANSETKGRVKLHGRNTLSGGFKVRHSTGLMHALQDIADAYGKTRKDFETTKLAFSALTGKPLTSAAFDAMQAAAFGIDQASLVGDERSIARAIAQTRKDRIEAILASETCQVNGTKGTLWSGLQAVTEYIDHEARTRTTAGGDQEESQRFASSCFGGAGDKAKAEAFAAALSFA